MLKESKVTSTNINKSKEQAEKTNEQLVEDRKK